MSYIYQYKMDFKSTSHVVAFIVDNGGHGIMIMAVTRLWAPLLVLLFACQLKLKWSKLVQNYDLDICEVLQTTCIQTISKNTTELLRNESGYREFSRAKKSCVIFRLGRLNDPSQLPIFLFSEINILEQHFQQHFGNQQ